MLTAIRPLAPVATPALTFEAADSFDISESWWNGFAQGCDGVALEVPAELPANLVASFTAGHWSGYDNWETEQLAAAASVPTIEDEFEDLGFRLGLDGEQAELLTPDAGERSAFDRGMNAGDVELWRVDPDFAAHVQAKVKADDQVEPSATWHDAELAEVGAFLQLMPMIGGGA